MATLLFSAAGAALGGSIGGTFAGLSSVAIGRAVGATLGRVVDQRLLGQGGDAVETGKVDRFRLTNAGEGAAIAQVYGRMRMGGHVIWASDFIETVAVSGGGKGSRPSPEVSEHSYAVSLAIGICEGQITRIGRVWADGEEVAPKDLNMRVYEGTPDQLPDPVMEAIEGPGRVPAYRGTAYVVMEDLSLAQFGNRIPQFSFEVIRPEQPGAPGWEHTPAFGVRGVAIIPGTGEYELATSPVNYDLGDGVLQSANVSTPAAEPDFAHCVEAVTEELPNLDAVSLVVSWFGDDLRCGECTVRPKVEQREVDSPEMPWTSGGVDRADAEVIVQDDGRPVYGGTPSDASVIEAIEALNAAGKAVMYYPFILMDPYKGNDLPDPYSDNGFQPDLPWRGRITLSEAPGRPGSPDGTAQAAAEVDGFFGTATAGDFAVEDGVVIYSGPVEWGLNRFILHNAALCLAAGGVEAFCIGSEMRGLTQIRGAANSFPAVLALQTLATEVRSLLGPQTKLSYAADWSEYFGHAPQDGSGDRFFHLDPLWADANIDFIGIDNYMPLADWRDEDGHQDGEHWDAIYDLGYLKSNIEGGEGYDWFYHSDAARAAQIRTDITDDDYNEPWVHRYKDLRGWWENTHHDRIGGVRAAVPTAWQPKSKPIWFTEYGCGAVDKGANQPNKFLDRKSSESLLPRFSTGARDELIQMQYLRAMSEYWTAPANNPVSSEYEGRMIDIARGFVWAWDSRPYPFFPNDVERWSDGENYARGHWINGRTSSRSLASVVREICQRAGLAAHNTERLYGYLRGYAVEQVGDARAALQPLMIRYGFDAVEREGVLAFRSRDGLAPKAIETGLLAVSDELEGIAEQSREAEAEVSGRVRVRFVQADADYDVIAEEAVLADEMTHTVTGSEMNMTLTRSEGRQIAERWLTEARVARETARLALPPSRLDLGAGDVIELADGGVPGGARFRIDRVEQSLTQLVDAVRIEPQVYDTADLSEDPVPIKPFVPPVPVISHFLDLPLLRGDEVPHAPHMAITAAPWPGAAAVFQSGVDADYSLNTLINARATVGMTKTALPVACAGVMDHGPVLEVKLISGLLETVLPQALLSGANTAAIGDGTAGNWEVFQFAEAVLVGKQTYWLRGRLRGQAGSGALTPQVWPEGSVFVLLDGTPKQIELSPNLRRVAQHFRIGPAGRGYDDPSYQHVQEAFDGNGLRPFSPCHLQADLLPGGDIDLGWIRRTRIGGDGWEAAEVPLGEESETYLVQVRKHGATLRQEIVAQAGWTYSAAAQTADGALRPFEIQVAQISAVYGAGLAASVLVPV